MQTVMQWIKMWTESQGRLPTYLLMGGSSPNVVHAFNFFFFFQYKTCLPEVKNIWRFQSCVSEDQRFGILAHVFRGPRIFGSQLMFFQKTKGFLGFGSCFQRTKGFGSWLMFLEDQGFLDPGSCFQRTQDFWVLAHVFRGPNVLDLGSCFQRTYDFWILAHFFKGPRVFGLWLMFSEDQRFWILAHVFRDLGFLDLGSCRCVWPFTLIPTK